MRQKNDGPSLPAQLRQQLGLPAAHGRDSSNYHKRADTSRKALRKAAREEKKQRQVTQPRHHASVPAKSEQPQIRKQLTTPSSSSVAVVSQKPKSILKKSKVAAESSKSPLPSSNPVKAVRKKVTADDAEIAALEKKLGMKGKKLPKAFAEDGLDELLEDIDSDHSGSETRKRKREGDEWLQSKRRMAQRGVELSIDESEDEEAEELEEDMGSVDLSEASDTYGEESAESGSDDRFDGFGTEDEKREAPPRKRENPYVAPATLSTQAKYIPPSLRKAQDPDVTETLRQLIRQTQGLLNKLSEANILSILGDVEKLYQTNPRQNITSVLLDLLFERFCEGSSGAQDTFVILHAAFIAAIYKVIGTDFGADVVARLVETFDRFYAQNMQQSEDSVSGKQCSNLVALMSQLYNLQVIGTSLVFDYIKLLVRHLTENNTELLLKIIKNSGSQLRRDDPAALKSIVLMIQPIAARDEAKLSVRTKFMIETITDLKNNRMKTGVGASTLMAEHLTKMRKILGSLSTRNVRGSEPLNISLEDVRNADKRGKWWLVGASWKEKTEAEAITVEALEPNVDENDDMDLSMADNTEIDMRQLAKEQGMNTDVRRSVFITVMSSTDVQDAYMRLMKLRLKKKQELEIPRVLTQCVGAEEQYNPYYALVAQKVCADKKLKMAFQFSLWDIFKRLDENFDAGDDDDEADTEDGERGNVGPTTLFNMGKFFAHLISQGMLSLSCLKILNMTHLQAKTRILIEMMLVVLILESQESKKSSQARDENAVADMFIKVKQTPQLIGGLQYFLKKVVYHTDLAGSSTRKETVKWGCKVAIDTLVIAGRGAKAP